LLPRPRPPPIVLYYTNQTTAISAPISYADRVAAPVLVMQGRNDTRCPARPMEAYEARLRALGKPIEVVWFDAGHGSLLIAEQIAHQAHMLAFARQVVGGE